ncbi:MAG: four helix bundle protein [Terriglobales bacterium]
MKARRFLSHFQSRQSRRRRRMSWCWSRKDRCQVSGLISKHVQRRPLIDEPAFVMIVTRWFGEQKRFSETGDADMSGHHKDPIVWQRAMELVLQVYCCTKTSPREETYGLVTQMRRAAVSIPSNIAEGKGRYSRKELTQFLPNARGSLLELGNPNRDRASARLRSHR